MNNAHDYREPWEKEGSDETAGTGSSLWKNTRFRILAALALVLALGGLFLDVKRSKYEDDIVTVYAIAHVLHRQPALSDIPMTDKLFTVRALVAGARTGTRGFVELHDLGDIEQVAAASLAGQRKVMERMFPTEIAKSSTGADAQLMASQITRAITRFYGRKGVSAELAAELLRRRGMDMQQIRAFLTQEMFSMTEDVYRYQLAILDEEQRVRNEIHQLPFGWLSGSIRGTYRHMDAQPLIDGSTPKLPVAQQAHTPPAEPKGTADHTTQAGNSNQDAQEPAWTSVESSNLSTSYIDTRSIAPQHNGTVRYALLTNVREPVSPAVSSIMVLEIDCKTRHYTVLGQKSFNREFGRGDLIEEMSAKMIERVAGVYFPSDETLLLHTKFICKQGQARA
jgi:hypothetical protein